MYKAVLECLCCPQCRSSLKARAEKENPDEIIEGTLCCEKGHCFHICQGVADFNSKEQDFMNQWEALSQEQCFEELDRELDAGSPAAIQERRGKVLDALVNKAAAHGGKLLLDIASGRGLLLTELAAKLPEEVHILSVDLSRFVLEHDRRKLKKIAPDKKISYLACDAAKLPFKDGSMDVATTYGGFSNMPGCAGEALREAYRVLKNDGTLLDSFVVISEDSKGYQVLKQVCAQQSISGAEEFYLHDGIAEKHEELFTEVACETVFEGVGVDNGLDLLPYEGEWYTEQIFQSKK